MDEEKLLRKILLSKELQEKYWPEVNVEAQNINTLLSSQNKYLKVFYSLFTDSNTKTSLNSIYKIFNII